jgi:hypothetical protein
MILPIQSVVTDPVPVLSVIVTVTAHNTVEQLRHTLDSLPLRAGDDCDCILVTDGAEEDALRLCRRTSRHNPRVRLVRHRVSDGSRACRNAGLRASRGLWAVFLDAGQTLAQDLRARHNPGGGVFGLVAGAGGTDAVPLQLMALRTDLLRAAGGWTGYDDPCQRLCAGGYQIVSVGGDLTAAAPSGPVPSQPPARPDIVFVPHKDYHVWTIALLTAELELQGLTIAIIDISAQWRDDGVRSMAVRNALPLVKLDALALGQVAPRLVVVFNDWDPITRPIVLAAQAAGIATAGIVEGIQDYDDADVSWSREAYRAVDTVLLPGDFDKIKFTAKDHQIAVPVGVARIEALRRQPIAPDRALAQQGRVLINSNFAYGVLINQRDIWLTTAVTAVLDAGMIPVISRHPAEQGTLFPEYITDLDFYTCVETCQATIQRFASGVIEALARQVPVLYFRPQGEYVDKYIVDPMGVYPVCTTAEDLRQALQNLPAWQLAVVAHSGAFLDLHAGPLLHDVAVTTVAVLADACGPEPDHAALKDFVELMRGIDRITMALTRPGAKEDALFGTLDQTAERLAACRTAAHLPATTVSGLTWHLRGLGTVLTRMCQRIAALTTKGGSEQSSLPPKK